MSTGTDDADGESDSDDYPVVVTVSRPAANLGEIRSGMDTLGVPYDGRPKDLSVPKVTVYLLLEADGTVTVEDYTVTDETW